MLQLVTDMDPVEQLTAAKEELAKKIASQKMLLRQARKSLTKIENLNVEVVPDKQERYQAKFEEISKLTDDLVEFEIDLKSLERTRDDETEEKIQAALQVVATKFIDKTPSTAYIIADNEFVFVTDYSCVPEKQNVQMRTMPGRTFANFLANELKLKSWHLPEPRLIDLYNSLDRSFHLQRYSVDPGLWQQNNIYLPIRHMEPYFINQQALTTEQQEQTEGCLEFFECLMYSLSGGKKENQDHIEQWILHKLINYQKAVTTPDLVIVGHVGGNGKGILQAIMRLMFPAMLTGKANSKTLNGNFNAIMLGKLIVFFDDQNSREIPLDVVKQLAGSETMIFEPKGKDQYEGEKTHSSAWFSNRLPFRLTPAGQEGGVDRRFSIMRTNITFLESLRLNLQKTQDLEITVEESKDLAEQIVSQWLLNRLCIARWWQHLAQKHPEVTRDFSLKALHGDDYKYFLEKQSDSMWSIFQQLIVPVVRAGGCVPFFVIKEILRHLDGQVTADKKISARLSDLAAENKLEIETTRIKLPIVSRGRSVKKQCSVVRPAAIDAWIDRTFAWDLVSTTPYTGNPAAGTDLIPDNALKFGMTVDAADNLDEQDDDTDWNTVY